jgi:hypothetical protein
MLAIAMALSAPTTQAKCAEFPTFLELGRKLPNAAIVHLRVTAVAKEERRYGSRTIAWPVVVSEVVSILRGTVDARTLRGTGVDTPPAPFNLEDLAVGSEWIVLILRRADRPKDTVWSDLDFVLGGCGESALRVESGRVPQFGGMTLNEFGAVVRRVLP